MHSTYCHISLSQVWNNYLESQTWNVQCSRSQAEYNVILIQIQVRPNNVILIQNLNIVATESNIVKMSS